MYKIPKAPWSRLSMLILNGGIVLGKQLALEWGPPSPSTLPGGAAGDRWAEKGLGEGPEPDSLISRL